MKSKYKFLIILILSLCCSRLFAQVDTIGGKSHPLITKYLKPGLKQYIIYMTTDGKNKTMAFWFWQRNIKAEDRDGQPVITISQQWFGSDTLMYRKVYSINKALDFSPLYFSETVKGAVRAYNWYADKAIGSDTVANNTKKDFKLEFKVPNYNFNLDVETFEMLPLAAGKTFAINFYDAGLGAPDYYIYKVTGSEVITTYDGQQIDCWKLETSNTYGGFPFSEKYWISKKNHEFLREEDQYHGGYRYKIKMPENISDVTRHFVTKQ